MNVPGKYPLKSVLPKGHRAFWIYLNSKLDRCLVMAGSMTMAQMLQNLFGETFVPNDGDFWYPDLDTDPFDEDKLGAAIGELP